MAGPAERRPAAKQKKGRWVVTGTVRARESGRPLKGLAVRAFDQDMRSDDYLGRDTTDESGRYEIGFKAAAFRKLFESRPDLYVLVYDASGRELASTKDSVRKNAGTVEEIDVEIPESLLG
jgi:hypothetical protein